MASSAAETRNAKAKLAAERAQAASAERRQLQFDADNRKDKQPMAREEPSEGAIGCLSFLLSASNCICPRSADAA